MHAGKTNYRFGFLSLFRACLHFPPETRFVALDSLGRQVPSTRIHISGRMDGSGVFNARSMLVDKAPTMMMMPWYVVS